MKVLHVTYASFPDPLGGTEHYVSDLCRQLARCDVDGVITAPAARSRECTIEGVRVRRFEAKLSGLTLRELYGDGDPVAAAAFARVLDDEAPDVVHQHALSPACSVRLLREAKGRSVPTVLTYHTPAVTCQRGTMLRWGKASCDGEVQVSRCSACTLHGLGVPRPIAHGLARMPASFGDVVSGWSVSTRATLAMSMTSLLAVRRARLGELLGLSDRIVVLTPWVREVLRRNGARAEQLVESSHGVETPAVSRVRISPPGGPLRVAHLGRLDPTKGTRLLVGALRAAPHAALTLDVFGVEQGGEESNAAARLAASDPRVTLHGAIPRDQVIPTIADFDVVAVPSQLLETGPLVALEAFAAGVPVVASRLGNLQHLVEDGVNGLLVGDYASDMAWAAALCRLADEPPLVESLRRGVRTPRTADAVAEDMRAVYERLTEGRCIGRAARTPA